MRSPRDKGMTPEEQEGRGREEAADRTRTVPAQRVRQAAPGTSPSVLRTLGTKRAILQTSREKTGQISRTSYLNGSGFSAAMLDARR